MVPIDLAYSGIGFTPAIFTSTERAKCLMARPNRYSLEEPWIGGPLRNRRGSLKCLKSGTRWRIAIRILRPTLTLHSESFSRLPFVCDLSCDSSKGGRDNTSPSTHCLSFDCVGVPILLFG